MTDLDQELDAMRAERLAQLRSIEVREPGPRDTPYSGGVIIRFELSPANSTIIDLNRREAAALLDALAAFLTPDTEPDIDDDAAYVAHCRTCHGPIGQRDSGVWRHVGHPRTWDTLHTPEPLYVERA